MAHCWEEYMWKVHKAVPVDPWATDVQLLDVLISERPPSLWLPPWLRTQKLPHSLSRAGSMFTLASKDSSCKPKAVASTGADDGIGKNVSSPNKNAATTDIPAGLTQNSASSTEPRYRTSGMPNIQASIRASTSLLAAVTGPSSSATAHFDVKDSKYVSCNVSGVETRHMDVDALMELVTPCMTSNGTGQLAAPWQPDISSPQLRWCSKRGQTLWVVIEIMYANVIRIEADNQAQATNKVDVLTKEGVELSKQVGVEKDGLWQVRAPKNNSTFPFGLRLQRLKYDANGSLVTSNKNLKTKDSFHKKPMRQLSSKHVDHLDRSLSLSRCLP